MALQVSLEASYVRSVNYTDTTTSKAGCQHHQEAVKSHLLVSTCHSHAAHAITDVSVRVFGSSPAMIDGSYEYPEVTLMNAITE